MTTTLNLDGLLSLDSALSGLAFFRVLFFEVLFFFGVPHPRFFLRVGLGSAVFCVSLARPQRRFESRGPMNAIHRSSVRFATSMFEKRG